MRQQSREEHRLLQKVVDRIERRGCDLCDMVLGGPVPHHFGRHQGRLVGVCAGCVCLLDGRPDATGVFDMPPPWQDEDREWFEANSGRSYRLREPIGQEVMVMTMVAGVTPLAPPPGYGLAIAVCQRRSGQRVRQIVFPLGPVSSYTEAGIRSLIPWHQFSEREFWSGAEEWLQREAELTKKLILKACLNQGWWS